MSFYDDLIKKVTDVFEKGYAYSAFLTAKVELKDKYFMNFSHKSEFLGDPIAHKGEYKMKYERDKKMFSFLGSKSKAEIETECEPCHWSSNGRVVKFKTKTSCIPKALAPKPAEPVPASGEGKKEAGLSWLRELSEAADWSQDIEAKVSLHKNIWNSVKVTWDKFLIPRAAVTGLIDYKCGLFGMSYKFNNEAAKRTDALEFLLGLKHKECCFGYMRHEAKNLVFPGKFGLGFWSKHTFNGNCESIGADKKVASTTCTLPTEFAAEGSIDLANKNSLSGRIGTKMLMNDEYSMQLMIDHDAKISSAYSYTPTKGFKFIWSDNFDAKKLFTNPAGGINYNYGFTIELSPGSL